jgi:hypothetical protein
MVQKYKPPTNPHKEKANQLCAEVEKRRAEINRNWGEHRFFHLLDADLMNRLRMMRNKYERSRVTSNYLMLVNHAEAMLRGYEVCEANAIERGHKELDGHIWSYYYERTDTRFLVVLDDCYYAKAVAMSRNEKPEPMVLSMIEILRLIPDDNWIFTLNVKKEFPGAEVVEPTSEKEIKSMGPVSSFPV